MFQENDSYPQKRHRKNRWGEQLSSFDFAACELAYRQLNLAERINTKSRGTPTMR